MLRKPCHFYNPATRSGCRNGDDCQYLHPDPTDTQNSPDRRGNRRPGLSLPSSPPNVCAFFWNNGACNRGSECRFRHDVNPAIDDSKQSSSLEMLLPFLRDTGLAKVTGPGSDAYFTQKFQSPIKVQSSLQPFLRDEFRFTRPSQVYAFVALLYSASADDPSWSTEDGQLLLNQLADPKGRGTLRFSSILTWPQVSLAVGTTPDVLSFQRGYVPLLKYLSSEYVVQSTLRHCKNALYSLIVQNMDHFADIVELCLDEAILNKRSFRDNSQLRNPTNASQVLKALVVVLFECTTLFKNAVASYPRLRPLVLKLCQWTDAWIEGINANPPAFDDFANVAIPTRNYIIQHISDTVHKLLAIVNREDDSIKRAQKRSVSNIATGGSNEGILAALVTSYDPPGEDRQGGPRHDNDFVDIQAIRIAPTHDELVCTSSPFLPANIYGAPHPFPIHSMQRLLDIQFRLLREELTAPLRQSVKLVLDDLQKPLKAKTRLSELVSKRGGKYRGQVDGHNSIMFNVYTSVGFSSLMPDRRGISVCLTFDTPPGRARSPSSETRKDFWQGLSGKRLMQGGLVALIWTTGSETAIHLGTLASSSHELMDSASKSSERVEARIIFFDSDVQLRIFQILNSPHAQKSDARFLVEAPVMFEAIRPFLEALRVEPEIVPFGDYLVHRPPDYFKTVDITPPAYAQVPGFSFQLKSLFPQEVGIEDLKLDSDPATIKRVRLELSQRSRLDPSQADAIVDALTREVALIQGPPGTGKSYTGVELLRVLIENNIRPVLMIAFTNHALDHMLRSVLDADITNMIARLGPRSKVKDDKVSQFSLEILENVSDSSGLRPFSNSQYRELKSVEEEIKNLLKDFSKTHFDSGDIVNHLDVCYSNHCQQLHDPPRWISVLFNAMSQNDGWKTAGSGREEEENTIWTFWRDGKDLAFLRKPDPEDKHQEEVKAIRQSHNPVGGPNSFAVLQPEVVDDFSDDEEPPPVEELWQIDPQSGVDVTVQVHQLSEDSAEEEPANIPHSDPQIRGEVLNPADIKVDDFFRAMNYLKTPLVPTSHRSLTELLEEGEMWLLSLKERQILAAYWTEELSSESHEISVKEFDRLRQKHADVLQRHINITNEARRQLLQNVDIIGCTTTGAAQLTSLLRGIAPKVMLVEEAGQVLEAHVLGSLVKGVEHLILIGDPLQLRPTIQNFALSMENQRGHLLYKFDMSLMERLATSGLHMSQIDIQRRMRPSISSLIRNTLYPGLQDHDLVRNYPPVRGMAKDVFFFTHNHAESGGEDESVSKYNKFEVDIIADLVMYLLRQGSYSNEGDIVVLCAYLGQLAKLRDALASKVAVVIDERDQKDLSEREEEMDPDAHSQLQHVNVSQRVRLRTIDNFQGEEAKIVILSLVRNSGAGAGEDDGLFEPARVGNGSIGFLKSENRTNVALSRAREGLYILGNGAGLSSRSKMWHSVIEELQENDAVGMGFPIKCDRHPEDIHIISTPGALPRVSPDGGCLRTCDYRLSCGHMCPYKCHSDDPNHIGVSCSQPCTRLCSRQHPCPRACNNSCGPCNFPVTNIELSCGHIRSDVSCYMLDDLDNVFCNTEVEKQLPGCDHKASMQCSQDPGSYLCHIRCNGILPCCGRNCTASCYACPGQGPSESRHQPHPCEKLLFCGHRCGKTCSQNHECNTDCPQSCRQECPHARCRNSCSSPCAPCQERCTWNCAHYQCPVPCGSICARLPCDRRCEKSLACGHRCPSVCGEICTLQICPLCATPDQQATAVDLVMGRTLAEVDPDNGELDELLITLPNCRHTFTVETLDGVCSLASFYNKDENGKWISLQAPPNDFLAPPACPTCRASITSPRYGRVFKRADLDILERNVASRMSRGLANVNLLMGSVSVAALKQDLVQAAAQVETPGSSPSQDALRCSKRKRTGLLKKPRDLPISYQSLNPGDATYHGVPPYDMKKWKPVVRRLFTAYIMVMAVAQTRSSHMHAWEAAFSYLCRKELDKATADPLRAPRNPNEHAMRMASMTVGQPRPLSDTRFRVEIFWTTIQIRFMLAELAQGWLKAISGHNAYGQKQQHVWATYILFVLESCFQDAELALAIAASSGSRRQMTKTKLLIMRSELERFSFNIIMSQKTSMINRPKRDSLLDAAQRKARAAERYVDDVFRDHDDQEWLSSNFVPIASKIMTQWREIETSLKSDVFYEEMTREEMEFVVRGLELPHTGHFYRCPNGHTFVIGDCGGAAEVSRCPECRAEIGGTGHTLLASNTRAMEYEEIARAQGTQSNPFPWGI